MTLKGELTRANTIVFTYPLNYFGDGKHKTHIYLVFIEGMVARRRIEGSVTRPEHSQLKAPRKSCSLPI